MGISGIRWEMHILDWMMTGNDFSTFKRDAIFEKVLAYVKL